MDEKIDFVLLWVDGNDQKWQIEKRKYIVNKDDANVNRYRDCDNLQYLFRGIEKYAKWVNKIYFITYGHLPKWLNTNNEKLVIVNHNDFIPKEYLPTFNSNVIELNIHRIKNLSEKFVLFNDDFFLLKETKPEDFFVNDVPTDTYVECLLCPPSINDAHFMMKSNIIYLINKYFNKKECIRKNYFKYINPKYGKLNKSTLYCMKYKEKFLGFKSFHEPYAYLKQTFETIWEKEGQLLDEACHNKFRTSSDLGHFLCKYWRMVSGSFVPKKSEGCYIYFLNDNSDNIKELKSNKYKFVCINDVLMDIDFEKSKKEINDVLNELFPKKSSFEI
ncbi:MAG: Stealth CR1 domain-containing protein [Clostridia bacterium]|nr:Stealth CR1 domain-containing protein [Clostridia bacterium]